MSRRAESGGRAKRRGRRAPGYTAAGERQTVLRVVDAAVLALAVMAACAPLVPVYGGLAAVPATVGGALLGAAAAASSRRLPLLVSLVGPVVAYVVAGTALCRVDGSVAGVVPTASTLAVLARGPVTTWSRVLTLPAPLGDDAEALIAALLIALVGAFAACSVAARAADGRRAQAAALVPVAVMAVSMVFASDRSLAAVGVGVGMAALLAFWAAWRAGRLRTRRPLALILAVAALAGGGAVAPVVVRAERLQVREQVQPPIDLSDLASPLSAFRRFVKDGDQAMLTVSGLPAGAPVRLATMDAYDGLVWNVSAGPAAGGAPSGDASSGSGSGGAGGSNGTTGAGTPDAGSPTSGFRRVSSDGRVPGASGTGDSTPSAAGRHAEVSVTIGALGGVWVPTVGDPAAIRGGEGTSLAGLQADSASETAILPRGLERGMQYTLDTRWTPRPSDKEIAAALAQDAPLAAVNGAPPSVAEAAAAMGQPGSADTGGKGAGKSAAKPAGGALAQRIAGELGSRGYFSHGLVGDGDFPSLSGHGAERMTAFLTGEVMVGDDEQYASAMALIAHQLGLPARVVMGFRTPEADGAKTGDTATTGAAATTTTFTGRDISAWVEVDLRGYGWVPFSPTPPESKRPDSAAPQPTPEPTNRSQQVPPRQPEPSQAPVTRAQAPPVDDAKAPREQADWRPAVLVAGGSALALLLLAAPFAAIVIAKATRRRRRRRAAEPLQRVTGGWDEVLALATDHGVVLARTATRTEKAEALAERWPQAGPVRIEALAHHADTAVFGDGRTESEEAERFWALVDELRAEVRAGSGWRRRLRARFSLRSLRRARRKPPGRSS
ncbi:transglutaminaseTgpA domain-containing protein [Leifsonia sp. F6_8S_P_1B]|uniref:TransglutaminaseTgpA domain-containing protein n=1 Tax=Leifsonia williamsii TaxID=3035919 RepID=A0ABT8KDD8_9MICO|nr:transglutaminaseTgpA domain-containing protein [Leifsonia williamsii]MDN4614339.1 transglutaminaseTgpA domain-containing protein [Leifsonia williamsii]